MAKQRQLDSAAFESILKDMSATGEMVRTRQGEREALLRNFENERARFKEGTISETAFADSTKKVNRELQRIETALTRDIRRVQGLSTRAHTLAERQRPQQVRVAAPRTSASARRRTSSRAATRTSASTRRRTANTARRRTSTTARTASNTRATARRDSARSNSRRK